MIINKINNICFFTLVFILFLNVGNICQELKFNYYTINDGLSQNTVLSIAQDTSGYLWFATRDGLNRFDGTTFYRYYNKFNDTTSLSQNNITYLLNDFEGNLWVGTTDGLNKYTASTKSFYRFKPNNQKANQKLLIKTLCRLNNNLLVGTSTGLWVLNIVENTFTKIKFRDTDQPLEIKSLYVIDNSLCLVGSDKGLFLLQENEWKLKEITNSFKNTTINSICKSEKGMVWLATEKEVFRFSPSKLEIKKMNFGLKHGSKVKDNIRHLYIDSEKRLWISTWDGLYLCNATTKNFSVSKKKNSHRVLSNNSINTVFEDKQGIIWVGTSFGGINYLDPLAQRFHNITSDFGITSSVVVGISLQKNGVWFSTIGGGVYNLDLESNKVIRAIKKPELLSNITRRIFCDSKNRVWISYWINALSMFDPKSNNTRHFKFYSNKTEMLQNSITAIYEADDGTVWFGGKTNEIFSIDDKFNIKKYTKANGKFSGKFVHGFFKIRSKLFCLVSNGIQYYQPDSDKFISYNADWVKLLNGFNLITFSIYDDSRFFFGTYQSGLLEVNLLSNKLTTYTVDNGMPNNMVYGILKDNNENLWLSTNKGLTSFNVENKRFKSYSYSDGIQGNEFNEGAYFKDNKGRLFFGGLNGITYFQPEKLEQNTFVPKTVITEINLLSKKQIIKFPSQGKNIRLNYDEKGISISFASLNYSFPQKNKYKYLIKESDLGWIELGTKNQITLANLETGQHTIIIKGSNGDDVWDSKGAVINFEILPPFFKTVWFISLVSAGLIFLIGIIIWTKFREAIGLERLRVQIASDLHDEIGSSLSKLSMNVGLLEFEKNTKKIQNRISRVQEISKETIGMMSDTVWSIDSRNDSLLDLIDRMSTHLTNMRNDTEIDLLFDYKIQSHNKKLPALIRQNIYLIFKEAVNNSIKYSYAKNIKCKLIEKKGYVFLSVKDSGVGFDRNKQSGGNGLRNMKMRADKLKADFKISSEKGVTIELSVKISG